MSKQPAFNGIDYAPRSAKAIAAKNARPMERHIHGVVQRKQHYPIFSVTSAGVCVEWTDLRSDAHAAFAKADALPKQLAVTYEDGRRVLLDEMR